MIYVLVLYKYRFIYSTSLFGNALAKVNVQTYSKMKKFLMIIAFVAIFATLTEADGECYDYNKCKPVTCNNWKKMDGPCIGCVFESGRRKGKCITKGKYNDKSKCESTKGGVWCKLAFSC